MTIIGDTTLQDRRDLQHLYRSEVGTVYGYLLARCGNRHVAEDLTTETFLNAADRFAQGRGVEVSGAWLMTVAKRRLVDHWRGAVSQRERIERFGRELGLGPARRREPIDDGDVDVAEADEARRRVLSALDALPERHRAALTLRYLDEHTVGEVADTLGLSYQAAESLLARARRGFVTAFEEAS